MPISTSRRGGTAPVLLALLLAGCAAGPVSLTPPPVPASASAPQAQRIAAFLHMGPNVMPLEKVPLITILQLAGVGDIHRRGDAGEALSWICYTTGSGALRQRLWLASDATGGDNLDVVIASSLPARIAANPDCPELPANLQPVSLDEGLWLGASPADLEKSTGAPFTASPRYQGITHREPAGYGFTESGSLTVGIDGGRVTQLWAGKATTD